MKLSVSYNETTVTLKEVTINVTQKEIIEYCECTAKEFKDNPDYYIENYLSNNLEEILAKIPEKEINEIDSSNEGIEFVEYIEE